MAAEPQGVAAFDFDGTMIRGDSFMPFLVRAVGPAKFGQIVIRSSASTAQAYRLGRRDASKAVLVRRLLRGYPADRLDDLGRRYAVLLAQRIRPHMAERVTWHQQRGHRLVIVSASLDVYLAPTGVALGFDHVLATLLEVGSDGRLTGRLQGPNVRGVEKSSRLRSWLARELDGAPYQLWAYGDSAGDRELLAMADHPVRV
ncbi:MAG: phosphatidylglycerophosphatase [Acidimicrobiaceae bacterium]|jgi:phosphatidylglycerophosphatase C|nr:phosphatidylglycerophosphatase [Acidimicrobiaceae bacterium]